jgi:hypothetical protein
MTQLVEDGDSVGLGWVWLFWLLVAQLVRAEEAPLVTDVVVVNGDSMGGDVVALLVKGTVQ